MKSEIQKYSFLGVSVSAFDKDQLLDYIKLTVKENRKIIIYGYSLSIFQFIKTNPEIYHYGEKSDLFVTDGRLFFLLCKHNKLPLKFDISIPNLIVLLLDLADQYGWSIYLLGARTDININAQERIKRLYPNIRCVGGYHGYFNEDETNEIKYEINKSDYNILLIGISSPEKEKLAYNWKKDINVNLIIPCGGMIDVLAGKTKLTPKLIKKLGLASIFRFIQEPRRLFRRRISFYWFFLSKFIPLYIYHVILKRKKDFSLVNIISKP